jgi:hypothetical protein
VAKKEKKPKKGRTVILVKKGEDTAKWVRWLEKNCKASAGPHPSLKGARKEWGRESLIVKSGAYLYLISSKDNGRRRLPWM